MLLRCQNNGGAGEKVAAGILLHSSHMDLLFAQSVIYFFTHITQLQFIVYHHYGIIRTDQWPAGRNKCRI